MTIAEIDIMLSRLKDSLNFQLTNVLFDEKALQISLSSVSHYFWLSFSLKPGHPYFYKGPARTPLIKDRRKPLGLFMRTHFKNLYFVGWRRDPLQGRRVQFFFSSQKSDFSSQEILNPLEQNSESEHSIYLEAILFPGGQNIGAYVNGKQLWAFKPKSLSPNEFKKDFTPRDPHLERFEELWCERFESGDVLNPVGQGDPVERQIKKKKNGLIKMEEKLLKMESEPWQALGNWLKLGLDDSQCPDRFQELFDPTLNRSAMMQKAFEKYRKSQAKIQGTKERILALKQDIANLQSGKNSLPGQGNPKKDRNQSLLHQAEAKGRTQNLMSGDRLFIGKSGRDNLALLRRAKPWYVWIHIRDQPGAHGIIELQNKKKEVTQKTLYEAAQKLLVQSLPKGKRGQFDVLFAQCRYVRPQSGSKPGQVTYSHERVLTVTLETTERKGSIK